VRASVPPGSSGEVAPLKAVEILWGDAEAPQQIFTGVTTNDEFLAGGEYILLLGEYPGGYYVARGRYGAYRIEETTDKLYRQCVDYEKPGEVLEASDSTDLTTCPFTG
jgi:hypothetical protein